MGKSINIRGPDIPFRWRHPMTLVWGGRCVGADRSVLARRQLCLCDQGGGDWTTAVPSDLHCLTGSP
jgi:hypothetical protein